MQGPDCRRALTSAKLENRGRRTSTDNAIRHCSRRADSAISDGFGVFWGRSCVRDADNAWQRCVDIPLGSSARRRPVPRCLGDPRCDRSRPWALTAVPASEPEHCGLGAPSGRQWYEPLRVPRPPQIQTGRGGEPAIAAAFEAAAQVAQGAGERSAGCLGAAPRSSSPIATEACSRCRRGCRAARRVDARSGQGGGPDD